MEQKTTEELISYYKDFLVKVFGTNLTPFQEDFEKLVQEYDAWLKHLTYSGTEQWKKGQNFLYRLVDLLFSHLPRR